MIQLGADEDIFEGELDLEDELSELVGNEIIVVTNIQVYEGNDRTQVVRFKAP